MRLSIIITNYKNPELLKVCLDSIRKNCHVQNFEIIVADSETQEKTEMMMREDYPDIQFLPSAENIGFGETMRRGYNLSRGEFILILNGDIIIKENSVEKLIEYQGNNPTVGIVGPQLLNFNETLQYSCFRFYTPLTVLYRRTILGRLPFAKRHIDRFLMKDFDHRHPQEVDWLMGSAMLTKRECVEKVGLIDRRFRMYFEDTDWCRRFWENKLKVIYYPDAKMYHYHGKGSANKNIFASLFSNKLAWLHILSGIKYFLKYANKKKPAHG